MMQLRSHSKYGSRLNRQKQQLEFIGDLGISTIDSMPVEDSHSVINLSVQNQARTESAAINKATCELSDPCDMQHSNTKPRLRILRTRNVSSLHNISSMSSKKFEKPVEICLNRSETVVPDKNSILNDDNLMITTPNSKHSCRKRKRMKGILSLANISSPAFADKSKAMNTKEFEPPLKFDDFATPTSNFDENLCKSVPAKKDTINRKSVHKSLIPYLDRCQSDTTQQVAANATNALLFPNAKTAEMCLCMCDRMDEENRGTHYPTCCCFTGACSTWTISRDYFTALHQNDLDSSTLPDVASHQNHNNYDGNVNNIGNSQQKTTRSSVASATTVSSNKLKVLPSVNLSGRNDEISIINNSFSKSVHNERLVVIDKKAVTPTHKMECTLFNKKTPCDLMCKDTNGRTVNVYAYDTPEHEYGLTLRQRSLKILRMFCKKNKDILDNKKLC